MKYPTEEGDLVLDPYSGGMPLDENDLQTLLDRTYSAPDNAPPLGQLLVSAGKKDILVRMLRNLKGVYQQNNQPAKMLNALNRILLIAPDLTPELLERARLHDQLECQRAALDDYQRYLALEPNNSAALEIGRRVAELKLLVARLN